MVSVNRQPPRNPRTAQPLAKIARASEHFDEAQRLVFDWQNSDSVKRRTRRDPATRRLHYIADAITPLPGRLALVVGDMVHNLRSALDHTAYQLFLANRGTPIDGKHVAFPIEKSFGEYRDSSNRKLRDVASAAKAAIDALRPYKGGDDRFYQISALDNADKHRLLLVVAAQLRSVSFGNARVSEAMSWALSPGSKIEMPPVFWKVANPKWPLEVGDILAIDVPDAEPDPTTQFIFDVVFDETVVCAGAELLGEMHELLSFTQNIVDGLEAHL
jgi:hypothetical protein